MKIRVLSVHNACEKASSSQCHASAIDLFFWLDAVAKTAGKREDKVKDDERDVHLSSARNQRFHKIAGGCGVTLR